MNMKNGMYINNHTVLKRILSKVCLYEEQTPEVYEILRREEGI